MYQGLGLLAWTTVYAAAMHVLRRVQKKKGIYTGGPSKFLDLDLTGLDPEARIQAIMQWALKPCHKCGATEGTTTDARMLPLCAVCLEPREVDDGAGATTTLPGK
jgi:hypothetical protein